jgi:phosphoribosylamine--glycine ligase
MTERTAHKVLVIGSGAREHAIIRALDRSSQKKEIYCLGTNKNPGINTICDSFTIKDINNPKIVKDYASKIEIDLAIIGPENPLSEGVSDALWKIGIKTVGPKKAHAQIETSKSFTRNLLHEYNIPGGPEYYFFDSMDGVSECLVQFGDQYVVKYDGLAGGKGVKVAGDHLHSHEEAIIYCQALINQGGDFIIEEKFIGEEFSLMSFCDGDILKHMPAVQDHKRAYEGDKGPNTGGMGTYSDSDHSLPFLNENDIALACEINCLTAKALKDKFGEGYKGILYGGFMITGNGVRLIEYNARFGDPEAMNVLSILESDFIDICNGIANGTLATTEVKFQKQSTVCKYAVPEGYPDSPVKGEAIDISNIENIERLFYASVDFKKGKLIEAGSRTVATVGVANSIVEAEIIAEKEISAVSGPLFHRSDIGTEAVIQKRIDHMNTLR